MHCVHILWDTEIFISCSLSRDFIFDLLTHGAEDNWSAIFQTFTHAPKDIFYNVNIFMGDVWWMIQEATLDGIYNSCDVCFLLRSWFIKDFLRSPPVSVYLLFFPFLAPPPSPVELQIPYFRLLINCWSSEAATTSDVICMESLVKNNCLLVKKLHYATLVIICH